MGGGGEDDMGGDGRPRITNVEILIYLFVLLRLVAASSLIVAFFVYILQFEGSYCIYCIAGLRDQIKKNERVAPDWAFRNSRASKSVDRRGWNAELLFV